MARAPKLYTRLTRAASGLGVATSLWLGPDHLMVVRSTGYSENYSRIQLADIKGFFLIRTERRLGWGLWWGAIALICAAPLIATLVAREAPIASAIFFGLAAMMFGWNHLLGPGSRAYVVTGVQTLELPSLVRLKKSRRILARLRPLIETAQADLVAKPAVVPEPPTLLPRLPSESAPA